MTRPLAPPVKEQLTPVRELLQLRPGVASARLDDGRTVLLTARRAEPLGRLTPAQETLLRRLAGAPAGRAALLDGVPPGGPEDPAGDRRQQLARQLDQLVARLRAGGWLSVTVTGAGQPHYTLVPAGRPPSLASEPPAELVLSRFALIRRGADGLVVESPRAWCEIHLHAPAAVAALAELDADAGALPPEVGRRLRRDLWWAGLAVPPGAEDVELRTRQWAPHELWFHHRSRGGDHQTIGHPSGRTSWGRGRFQPLPARPEPFPGPAVDLYRPDLVGLRKSDPSLTTVLEQRCSLREHDDERPLHVDQLGELLYRCARNRSRAVRDGVEYLSRPYPSGGAAYEIELYPVVRRVTGLDPGMYHYDTHEHRLEPVAGLTPAVRSLLEAAFASSGGSSTPQVLLVMSARFGRLMWSYETMAYSLMAKHVGLLCQTMYLVATAMGLAPCALGGGDLDTFAEATGLDPLVECSVGEFMVGSQRAGGEPS